jgi:hypothetical protein
MSVLKVKCVSGRISGKTENERFNVASMNFFFGGGVN